MIRILYITNGINGSGGLERVLSIKASYLGDKLDYDVHILTLNDGDKNIFFDFSKKIVFQDIKVSGSKPLNFFLSYRNGIQKVLNEVKPDVISVCDDGVKGLMFPLLFGKKTPVIYERHVSKQIENQSEKPSIFQTITNKLKFKFMDFSGSKFDSFVVLTDGNIKEWNLKNLKVISNPMPFESAEKSNLSSKTVLVVGKQSYQKGYDRLLEVWKLVSEKHIDWKLEIYGKLDPSLGLELMSEKLGISNKVTFYPPVKNIHEKYKKASIYIMTSRFEGFGMVLIEAMHFGLPCISFDCPHGPSDIISNEVDGQIIENGDIKAFANAIIKLIEDSSLRNYMSTNAIEKSKQYDIVSIGNKWDNLFKSLVVVK